MRSGAESRVVAGTAVSPGRAQGSITGADASSGALRAALGCSHRASFAWDAFLQVQAGDAKPCHWLFLACEMPE